MTATTDQATIAELEAEVRERGEAAVLLASENSHMRAEIAAKDQEAVAAWHERKRLQQTQAELAHHNQELTLALSAAELRAKTAEKERDSYKVGAEEEARAGDEARAAVGRLKDLLRNAVLLMRPGSDLAKRTLAALADGSGQ